MNASCCCMRDRSSMRATDGSDTSHHSWVSNAVTQTGQHKSPHLTTNVTATSGPVSPRHILTQVNPLELHGGQQWRWTKAGHVRTQGNSKTRQHGGDIACHDERARDSYSCIQATSKVKHSRARLKTAMSNTCTSHCCPLDETHRHKRQTTEAWACMQGA